MHLLLAFSLAEIGLTRCRVTTDLHTDLLERTSPDDDDDELYISFCSFRAVKGPGPVILSHISVLLNDP